MIHHKLALIGKNIGYSLSEPIHTISAQHCGIKDFQYSVIDLQNKDIPPINQLRSYLKTEHITSFNITTPFKQSIAQAFGYTNQKKPKQQRTQKPYNIAWTKDHTHWHFANTDGKGSLAALSRANISLQDIEHIIFFGYGGAMHALYQAILENLDITTQLINPKKNLYFHVLWRRIKQPHSHHLKKRHNHNIHHNIHMLFYPFTPHHFKYLLAQHQDILIVQCTPLPHQKNDMANFAEHIPQYTSRIRGCHDMTYAAPSAFKHYSSIAQIPFASGLDMLIEQARLNQILWWKQSASFEHIQTELQQYSLMS
ncbi:MAG: hypothetical protein OXC44_04250 [Proteobacteria bacterium]|nr:hypothetical protein [Pseudomonadota bacterium]